MRPKEQEFLLDQRSTRRVVIGPFEKAEKNKLRKREDRETRESMKSVNTSLKSAANQDHTIIMYFDSGDQERSCSTLSDCEELISI